jgi:hypothetical protein
MAILKYEVYATGKTATNEKSRYLLLEDMASLALNDLNDNIMVVRSTIGSYLYCGELVP